MSAPIRLPRGRRGTTTVIVAVLLLAVAAAAGYLTVMAALNRPVTIVNARSVLAWTRSTSWNATVVLYIGIAMAAIGVILLAVALLPARRRVIELTGPDSSTGAAITRKGLRRTLQSAVAAIDGISAANADIRRRTIRLNAVSGLRHTDGLPQAATDTAETRLQVLDLRDPRTVTTRLHRKDS